MDLQDQPSFSENNISASKHPTPSKVKLFGPFERMLALRYLSATKKGSGVSLISIIALVGITLAVSVLIIVMSVMTGFRNQLLDQLLGLSGHVFIQDVYGEPLQDYDAITNRLSSIEGITSARPIINSFGYLTSNKGEDPGIVYGIRPEDLRAMDVVAGSDHLLAGSLDDFGQGRKGGNKIAIASGLAAKLRVGPGDVVTLISGNGADTPMGTAPFRDKDYIVGAIFSVDNSEYDEVLVYMPLEQAQLFFKKGRGVDQIEFRIDDPTNNKKLSAIEEQMINASNGEYRTFTWQDVNKSKFDALRMERVMLRLILSLIVLIAVLNIITGLVMLVKDKTSDIAVMRTIGAPKWSIMRVFFLSGSMIGIIGTILGVVLGVIITLNLGSIEQTLCAGGKGICLWDNQVYLFKEVPAHLQLGEVLFVTGFSLLASFLSTLYPAWRAAKLDPVEALRYN
ncbi:MAG: lipoprotein-releasing ABC transporter permease subunit [bacterium]